MIDQSFSDRCPAGSLDHFGVQRGLIDKYQALQELAHERLTLVDPDMPQMRDIKPVLFAGEQGFFYG